MERNPVAKIVSGGQPGVDRAALDAALSSGIPCGGWFPKDRYAGANTACANSSSAVFVVFSGLRPCVGTIAPALKPRSISSIASTAPDDIPEVSGEILKDGEELCGWARDAAGRLPGTSHMRRLSGRRFDTGGG